MPPPGSTRKTTTGSARARRAGRDRLPSDSVRARRAGGTAALLEKVGFTDLREDRRTHRFVVSSEGEYLDAMLNGTPMGHSIREETLEVQEKIIAKTRQNLQRWRTRRGFELPCECVRVTGRK